MILDKKTKHDRRNEFNELLKTISYDNNQQEIKRNGRYDYHSKRISLWRNEMKQLCTENMKTIQVKVESKKWKVESKNSQTLKIGEFVKVKIVGADKFVLQGEVIWFVIV